MWEDELTRKLEAAVIGGSSDPATVHFLLEHPMLKPGSEGPVPMSDREMLATLPSSVLNLHDDECEACQGNDAEHSCRGSSTFSGLIRKVRRCKCRLRALCIFRPVLNEWYRQRFEVRERDDAASDSSCPPSPLRPLVASWCSSARDVGSL